MCVRWSLLPTPFPCVYLSSPHCIFVQFASIEENRSKHVVTFFTNHFTINQLQYFFPLSLLKCCSHINLTNSWRTCCVTLHLMPSSFGKNWNIGPLCLMCGSLFSVFIIKWQATWSLCVAYILIWTRRSKQTIKLTNNSKELPLSHLKKERKNSTQKGKLINK